MQLGDEMVCGSVKNFSFENLSALAARMHDALHPHGVFIFTNGALCCLSHVPLRFSRACLF